MTDSSPSDSHTLKTIFPELNPPQGVSIQKIVHSKGSISVYTPSGTRKGKEFTDYIKEHRTDDIVISEPHIWRAIRQFIKAANWLSLHSDMYDMSVWIHVQSLCMVDGLPWFDTYGSLSSYQEFCKNSGRELLPNSSYLDDEAFSSQDFTWCLGLFISSLCLLKDPKDIVSEIVPHAQHFSFVDPNLVCSSTYSACLNDFIKLCLTCDPTKRPDIGMLGLLAFSNPSIMVERPSEQDSLNLDFLHQKIAIPSVDDIPLPAIAKISLNMRLDNMVSCILQHRNEAFQEYMHLLNDYSVANYAMFIAYKALNIELGISIVKHMTELGHPPPSYPVHAQETSVSTRIIYFISVIPHTNSLSKPLIEYIQENKSEIGMKYLNIMALHMAAKIGKPDIVEALMLEIGFYKDFKTTPLMFAAESGKLEAAKLLMILAGIQNRSGTTALMIAASQGYVNLVRLLKDKETKMTNNLGQTALMIAVHEDHLNVITELAPYEGSIVNNNGMTALMFAVQKNKPNAIDVLAKYELGIKSKTGETALIWAANFGKLKNLQPLLSEAGLQDNYNRTALMHAVIKNKQQYISQLFPLEAQMVDNNLWTATMHAVKAHKHVILIHMINFSIDKYPDKSEINMRDRNGNTALIIALFLDNFKAVEALLPHEWMTSSLSGESTFEIAVKSSEERIIELVYKFYERNGGLNQAHFEKIFLLSLKRRTIQYPLLILDCFSSKHSNCNKYTEDAKLLFSTIEHGIVPSIDSKFVTYFCKKDVKDASSILQFLNHTSTVTSSPDKQNPSSLQSRLNKYTYNQQVIILFGAISRCMTELACKVLKNMLEKNADCSVATIKDHSERSLFMAAIEVDNHVGLSAVLALLRKPLSIEHGSALLNHGITYLAHNSMQVICDYLLDHKIYSSVKSREGITNSTKTPLIHAVTNRDKEKVLKLRITDPSKNHPYNDFNILWYSGTGCRSALMTANSNIVSTDLYKYLLCNMGIHSMDNFTALQDACLLANWNITKYFIFEREVSGMTWLMIYAAVGDVEQVKKHLNEAGRRAGFDYTALIYAARNGHADCVRLLVETEAGATTITGRSALFWALFNGHDACAELLYSEEHRLCDSEKQTPLMAAAVGGSVAFISKMVEAGLYIDSIDCNGETALMKAADANRPACVDILIAKTKDPGKKTPKGVTALMFAAMTGSTECIEKLIPVEVGMCDLRGSTALMYAASNGQLEAVRSLIVHEGGMVANDGTTALFLAGLHGHLECVKLLYPYEYSVVVKNSFNIIRHLSECLFEITRAPHRRQNNNNYEDNENNENDDMDSSEDEDGDEWYDNEEYDEGLALNITNCIEYLLAGHDHVEDGDA